MVDFTNALTTVRKKHPNNHIRFGFDTNKNYVVFVVSPDEKFDPLDIAMIVLVNRESGEISYTNSVGFNQYADAGAKPILVDLSKKEYEEIYGPIN